MKKSSRLDQKYAKAICFAFGFVFWSSRSAGEMLNAQLYIFHNGYCNLSLVHNVDSSSACFWCYRHRKVCQNKLQFVRILQNFATKENKQRNEWRQQQQKKSQTNIKKTPSFFVSFKMLHCRANESETMANMNKTGLKDMRFRCSWNLTAPHFFCSCLSHSSCNKNINHLYRWTHNSNKHSFIVIWIFKMKRNERTSCAQHKRTKKKRNTPDFRMLFAPTAKAFLCVGSCVCNLFALPLSSIHKTNANKMLSKKESVEWS